MVLQAIFGLKSKISIFMGMKPDAGGIKIRNGNEI
jgi:hypothetical protein